MQAFSLLIIFISYFLVLLLISFFIGKKSGRSSFYNGDRKSPWFVVAFGMVGATLSGVTFISVPGEVGNSAFHYFQFVMGNFVGYILIATLLLPYYYRKNIVSIYSVLSEKLGKEGYLTTSGFFILSKVVGAAFRLYLAALVLFIAIAQPLGISFGITILFCLVLIWLYTFKSGIKMVVWSDLIQTSVLIIAVIACIIAIKNQLQISSADLIKELSEQSNTSLFEFNWKSPNNFFKQFTAGIFMTIALNGFDQDIVQKNLSCSSSNKARTNMFVFSMLFVLTVLLFLILGTLLYYFAQVKGISIPVKSDQLFPTIALGHLGKLVAALFIIGISAAAFSSADSATTALTTSFSIDFLKINQLDEKKEKKIRNLVHLAFNLILFIVIYVFYKLNNDSVVVSIFKAAGYTYGPIFGVFSFLFFINRIPVKKYILPICIAAPIITYLLTLFIQQLFENYKFGFELIIINAFITFLFLVLLSRRKTRS